ncbi:DedA family protein [Plesiomonas shigelloides]|jgi:membrane protein DedA with SNARE-associated domain|uniref:DedA family protein n=1 Tax=Plesiomonas shigelloides TaxID=703 RepID=UPI0017852363|nr:DedA family protein [Plesiomonas shigelloides]QOH79415.1 DedA family protein [Plesiomonas shigelloides]
MEALLNHLQLYAMHYALSAAFLAALIESIALIGLLVPSSVIMTSIGLLIGHGEVNFWLAWLAATLGCMVGDWGSYLAGHYFQAPLRNFRPLQRYQSTISKIEYALHQHSMPTIFWGRHIGPTRPIVPLAAGMLNLPPRSFALPNFLACATWPPVYLLPGILAGVALGIPQGQSVGLFRVLLLLSATGMFFSVWLGWRWLRHDQRPADWFSKYLTLPRLRWLTLVSLLLAVVSTLWLLQQPLMPLYADHLRDVLKL